MRGRSGRPTGRFSYDVATDTWDWDDDVFRIHGLAPGSATPTLEFVLASKHPADRDRVAALLERVSRTGGPFSISYRLIAQDGVERRVVLVGEGTPPGPGSTAVIEGYYTDLTRDFDEDAREAARAAVAASVEDSAVIEQAKGILMLVYGLDSESALSMLGWWSRTRDQELRELATRLVQLAANGHATDAALRHSVDAALHDISRTFTVA